MHASLVRLLASYNEQLGSLMMAVIGWGFNLYFSFLFFGWHRRRMSCYLETAAATASVLLIICMAIDNTTDADRCHCQPECRQLACQICELFGPRPNSGTAGQLNSWTGRQRLPLGKLCHCPIAVPSVHTVSRVSSLSCVSQRVHEWMKSA